MFDVKMRAVAAAALQSRAWSSTHPITGDSGDVGKDDVSGARGRVRRRRVGIPNIKRTSTVVSKLYLTTVSILVLRTPTGTATRGP